MFGLQFCHLYTCVLSDQLTGSLTISSAKMSTILNLVNNLLKASLLLLILFIPANRASSIENSSNNLLDYQLNDHNSVYISNAFTPQLTSLSIGQRCTDSQQCRNDYGNVSCIRFSPTDQFSVCALIDYNDNCYDKKFNLVECPPGSFLLKSFNTTAEYCAQTCRCQSDICYEDKSPNGCAQDYIIDDESDENSQILNGSLSDDRACCSLIGCQHEPEQRQLQISNYKCIGLKDGEQWIDNCQTCYCKEGIAFCNHLDQQACATVCSTNHTIAYQHCCPRCKECIDDDNHNQRRQHLERWTVYKNSCKDCECINGKTLCSVALCIAPSCGPNQRLERPIYHCCERCVCNLDCKFGLKHQIDGSELCECNPVSSSTASHSIDEVDQSLSLSELSLSSTNCDPNNPNFVSDHVNCNATSNQDSFIWPLNTTTTTWVAVTVLLFLSVVVVVGWLLWRHQTRPKSTLDHDIDKKNTDPHEIVALNLPNTDHHI